MKRYIVIFGIFACLTFVLAGCSSKFNEEDFIGKTSVEIENEYGSFDCTEMFADEDGLYRKCKCGYTIKESQMGFLGTSDEILYFISFDENGIAVKCDEGPRPGG